MSQSATSTRFLNTSRDGDSTTSLGSLFQCLTTLSVNKLFLISSLTLPGRNLTVLPLVPSLVTWEKRPPPASLQPPFTQREGAARSTNRLLESLPGGENPGLAAPILPTRRARPRRYRPLLPREHLAPGPRVPSALSPQGASLTLSPETRRSGAAGRGGDEDAADRPVQGPRGASPFSAPRPWLRCPNRPDRLRSAARRATVRMR